MGEINTRAEFESMKVAELREKCDELNLETQGLKKAEIVDLLVEYYDEVGIKEELEECEDATSELDVETVEVQNTVDSEIPESPEVEITDKSEELCEDKESNTNQTEVDYKIVSGAAILYKDKECTQFLAKVSGRVKIINGIVHTFIPGRGELKGYLK